MIRLIRLLGPNGIPRLQTISVNADVLLFALGVTVASVLLFGLVPALNLSRASEGEAPEGWRKESIGRRRIEALPERPGHHRDCPVTCARCPERGLLIRTYERLTRVDPGFQTRNVLSFAVSLPDASYHGPSKVAHFYAELIRRLELIPGVQAAGASTSIPLAGGGWGKFFSIEQHPAARLSDVPPDSISRGDRRITSVP